MNKTNTNSIERTIELKAPVSRVWQALTDYKQFGQWFRVEMEQPFVAGQSCRGKNLYPGYEHLLMDIKVHKIEPETYFSYYWHPFACEPGKDYSSEPPTLVEFKLKPIDGGTLLVVSESGFDAIPAERRDEAFRMNSGGWAEQVLNIQKYVENDVKVK